MARVCTVVVSDSTPYDEALRIQRALFTARRVGLIEDTLWLVEHPSTITVGRHPGARSHLLMDEETLAARGITVYDSDRGGDITWHGPGQLVGYPIFDLHAHYLDAGRYLRDLEEALIQTLADFTVEGRRIPGLTGVWVGDEKIAAIGVKISYWVTMHGFSLNVAPNLTEYNAIIPCGIEGKQVTSLARVLSQPVTVKAVQESIICRMLALFQLSAERTSLADLTRRFSG